jgi:hypothetical protein
MQENSISTQSLGDREAILHFKQSILSGKQWYIALLEATRLWDSTEEVYKGKTYRYLIGGEAFDLLLLAERLCVEADSLIPEEEMVALLFFATPPIELSKKELKELLGEVKYRAYLNYHYGVIIEEALILAVEEEVYKEQRSSALYLEETIQQEAYQRVYGTDKSTLLYRFRSEIGYPHDQSTTLTEQKEFTYWLFKYRMKQCERARVASDTKKALQYLENQWALRRAKKPGK